MANNCISAPSRCPGPSDKAWRFRDCRCDKLVRRIQPGSAVAAHEAWRSPDAAVLDDRSLGAWIDEQAIGPIARAYQQVWTTLDYGVEPEQLSLLTFARDERMLQAYSAHPSSQAPGGLDQLTQA